MMAYSEGWNIKLMVVSSECLLYWKYSYNGFVKMDQIDFLSFDFFFNQTLIRNSAWCLFQSACIWKTDMMYAMLKLSHRIWDLITHDYSFVIKWYCVYYIYFFTNLFSKLISRPLKHTNSCVFISFSCYSTILQKTKSRLFFFSKFKAMT